MSALVSIYSISFLLHPSTQSISKLLSGGEEPLAISSQLVFLSPIFLLMSTLPAGYGLPKLPTGPMTADDLTVYSNALIEAYSHVRITTPYPRTQGIKNVRIRLPPLPQAGEISGEPALSHEPVATSTLDIHPVVQASAQPATISIPTESVITSQPVKCFLHQKPKPSCNRCKAYLDSKQSQPHPKKPRLDYSHLPTPLQYPERYSNSQRIRVEAV